jgi:hypothetical protein
MDELRKLIEQMDKLPSIERIAVRSRINRGLSNFIDCVQFNDPNPPKVATRPAEFVEATEWYIRFGDIFPMSLVHGQMAWMVAMAQALEQETVTIEHGKMLARVPVR